MSRSWHNRSRRYDPRWSAWKARWRGLRDDVRTGLARVRNEVIVAGAGVPRREERNVTEADPPRRDDGPGLLSGTWIVEKSSLRGMSLDDVLRLWCALGGRKSADDCAT